MSLLRRRSATPAPTAPGRPGAAPEDALATALVDALAEAPARLGRSDALELVCRATGWPVGHAWVRLDGSWRSGHDWYDDDTDRYRALHDVTDACDLGPGRGVVAAVLHLEATRFLADLAGLGSEQRQATAQATGLRAMVGVPVTTDNQVVTVLEFLTESEVFASDALADALGRVTERITAVEGAASAPVSSPSATPGLLADPRRAALLSDLERLLLDADGGDATAAAG